MPGFFFITNDHNSTLKKCILIMFLISIGLISRGLSRKDFLIFDTPLLAAESFILSNNFLNIAMKKIFLLLCDGTEILEAAAFFDVFGWTGTENTEKVNVITAGLRTPVTCAFGLKVIPDIMLPDADAEKFDALAVPGGFGRFGYYTDAYSEPVIRLIKKFAESNKPIASVCVGALPVAKAGILTGRRGTTYHLMDGSSRKQLAEFGVQVVDASLVRDGNIITSTSPGTAVEVALNLLAELTGLENADHIRRIMGFDK